MLAMVPQNINNCWSLKESKRLIKVRNLKLAFVEYEGSVLQILVSFDEALFIGIIAFH